MATFTNQATLSYGNVVTNSNVAVGEILEVLSATKNAVSTAYTPGEDVTYTISIVNSGTADFTGLTVTDNLGATTTDTGTVYPLNYKTGTIKYYINGVLQPEPPLAEGPPLAVNSINVPAGGNALLVYEADVTEFATPGTGGTINNTATVTGAGLTTPVTAAETLPVNEAPVLAINKAISPATVTENSRVTYTFTILNNGNTDATVADNAVITDTFDPILTDLAVTYNGTAWAPTTNYTYNDATGAFATTDGQITVPAATTVQNPDGTFTTTPGVSTLTVTGTI